MSIQLIPANDHFHFEIKGAISDPVLEWEWVESILANWVFQTFRSTPFRVAEADGALKEFVILEDPKGGAPYVGPGFAITGVIYFPGDGAVDFSEGTVSMLIDEDLGSPQGIHLRKLIEKIVKRPCVSHVKVRITTSDKNFSATVK